MKPLLIPIAACALSLTACAGISLPTVTVTERPAHAAVQDIPDSAREDIAQAAFRAAWDVQSPQMQSDMCSLFHSDADFAWQSFLQGVNTTAGAGMFTRADFDSFFSSVC